MPMPWRLWSSARRSGQAGTCVCGVDGAHGRTALQVDTVVGEAQAALAAGQCVVVGLQSTGEAAADAVGLGASGPGPVDGWVSPCKELLIRCGGSPPGRGGGLSVNGMQQKASMHLH